MSASQKVQRVPELDAIRGLAAIAILIYHLPLGFWFGAHGVDLFFVLSGYLITSIIIANSNKSGFYKTFMVRRALRIWPIYYLTIFAILVLNSLRKTQGSLEGLPYYLLYLQNVHCYWGSNTPECLFSLGHTWTLAIEEQFYIFWPLILIMVGKRGVLPISIALIVIPIVARQIGLDRATLLGHSEGFGWGGILSVIMSTPLSNATRVNRWRSFFAVCFLGSAIAYCLYAMTMLDHGMTGKKLNADNIGIALVNMICFGLVGLIITFTGTRWLMLLRWQPLVYLGMLSYGLYLYHWVIYELLDTYFKFGMKLGDPLWLDALKIAVSLVVAVLSWHLIESPILSLKDRFGYGAKPEVTKVEAEAPSPSQAEIETR